MSTRRSWIRVTVDPVNNTGTVAGWNAKELIVECGGRPMWSRMRNAWCTSERVASDVIAVAESRRIAVQFTSKVRGEV